MNITERETDFLQYAATDKPYKQIADEMGVSRRTVDGYTESLFKKTNTRSRVGLVVWAIKNGVVKL